jgi:hypothetical protein
MHVIASFASLLLFAHGDRLRDVERSTYLDRQRQGM